MYANRSHPERLSNEELIQILNALCVNVQKNATRTEILRLFKMVALPLPKRNKSLLETKCPITNNIPNEENFSRLNLNEKPTTYDLPKSPKKLFLKRYHLTNTSSPVVKKSKT